MDAKYYVRILEEQLPEVREMMGNNWRFQQDNDPKHTSHLAKNFLQENVPAWALTKRNVEKRKPKNLDELETFMIEEWYKISDEIINNLIKS
ncbi:hypothetical protein RhiirA5_441425 [Rhizophagus irregularis]|uniref:Transposable element tc3 transposase n=1 Tax=Rhizophagus irregularis TaxID=588596 RepID=A0A2N0NFS9_9GLOM|nr:hypothetical protein RhiirA5_441425 [Rhizophagus irregularis]